jgi:flagellar protein FlaG
MRLQPVDSKAPPLVNESGGIGASGSGTDAQQARAASAATQAPPAPPVAAPTQQELRDAIAQANTSLQKVASSLQFEIDPDTKQTVIQLVDTSDHKVLRQVPSPEVIAIAKAIDKMQGLLIKQVA